MPHVQWKDRFNINYKDIDDQHRGLIAILNDLIDLVEGRGEPALVTQIFHRLFEYSLVHFATEERYMERALYPGLAAHKAAHATFMMKLVEFNETYDATDPRLLDAALDFLRGWYLGHIMGLDMEYQPHLQGLLGRLPLRAVLFDFGNVLVRFDNRRFLAWLSGRCRLEPDELHRRIYGASGILRDFETGRVHPQEFARELALLCEQPIEAEALEEAYSDIFTPIEETLELVRRLKPHLRLGLISDTSPWHFKRAIRPCPVFELFDAVTLSFQVGRLKPDRALYEDALARLDLIAEECVVVDDLETNVEAAKALRFHALHFTTSGKLEGDLRRLGLPV